MKKLFAVLLTLAMLLSVPAWAESAGLLEGAEPVATPEPTLEPTPELTPEPTPTPTLEPTPTPTPDPEEVARQAFIAQLCQVWYLNEMTGDDKVISPTIFGLDRSVEFRTDGTVVTTDSRDGSAVEGTWTLDGKTVVVNIDDAELTFVPREGSLVCEQAGLLIVFGLEKAEEEMFEPAAPVEAALEDFQGTWVSYQLGMNDTYMSSSLMDMDVVATIDDTLVKLDGFVFNGELIQTELVDGALVFQSEDIENDLTAGFTAQLLEDGTLLMTATANDDCIVFAMARAEAEE